MLVDIPLGYLEHQGNQVVNLLHLATAPIWVPIWVVDRYFQFDIFQHWAFNALNIFYPNYNQPKDTVYPTMLRLEMDFEDYETYFFTDISDHNLIQKSLANGIESLNKTFKSIKIEKKGLLSKVEVTGITLYDLNYLVSWLQNEVQPKRVYGFSMHNDFSFVLVKDKCTLHNILGKTSNNETFSFHLKNGQKDHLALNSKISFNIKYSVSFLKKHI